MKLLITAILITLSLFCYSQKADTIHMKMVYVEREYVKYGIGAYVVSNYRVKIVNKYFGNSTEEHFYLKIGDKYILISRHDILKIYWKPYN